LTAERCMDDLFSMRTLVCRTVEPRASGRRQQRYARAQVSFAILIVKGGKLVGS
jgi:hypothetical protein